MDGCQLHDTTVDALFAIIETDAQWSFAPSHCVQFLFGIGTRSPSLKTACIEVIQLAMKYFADVFTSNSWILFPICYGNHFFLAEIEYENRIFRLYNSLKKCVREDALFFFRRLIERASELKIYTDSPAIHEITAGEWELFNVEAAQQANYVDCGVFVIKYAMDLKNRSNDYNQPFDVVELRKSLQELLLSNVKYKQ
uniref:(northern house mosquito) hypothetical protein n=1 Tax=Culex pipiens TaxID=7175 RepID=A0A8D8AXJ5_CULPI